MKKYSYPIFLFLLCLSCCKELEELLSPPVAKEATGIYNQGFTANWEDYHGVRHFLLYVSEDPDFNRYLPGYEGKEVEGNSHEVKGLMRDHTYYYKIRAKVHDKISDYSNVISVQTTNHSLEAPVALPCENLEDDCFTARWEAVEGAEVYVLEVAYDEGFEHYVEYYERRVVEDLYKAVHPLTENTTYYYRLRAVKGKTWSRYSNVIECKTPKNEHLLESLVFTYNDGEGYSAYNATYNDQNQIVNIEFVRQNANGGEPFRSSRDVVYDEMNRIKSVKNNGAGYDYHYDEGDRISLVTYSISDGVPVVYYEYTYLDDLRYTEKVTYVNSPSSNEENLYIKDEKGNIVLIEYLTRGTREFFIYDDKKCPKYFFEFIARLIDASILENSFRRWQQNPSNLLGGSSDPDLLSPIYEYTYDQDGYPVKRVDIREGFDYEFRYYYKGDAENQVSAK